MLKDENSLTRALSTEVNALALFLDLSILAIHRKEVINTSQ
jgi:hypothetical protein